MTQIKRRSAAEIIAFHFCSDIQDWRDSQYQPGRYSCPVFTSGDYYYCAPTPKQKLPKGWDWKPVAEHYGRKIYGAIGVLA